MRGGFDRLQKEIDTLTYNSRTVLNALIRSTVVSGSSQGYKVTKVGNDIVLDRIDIYRLYRFYQEWENNNFAKTTTQLNGLNQKLIKGFDTIRKEQDLTKVIDENGKASLSATTDSLVKHSKLLYLNENNIDQLTENEFWLGLLRESVNPKLISNSSPIPINLRTPIFDENLATTRYNQHPTYLFPTAYYMLDILGYSGDNINHKLDGNSWSISGDDNITLNAIAISLGGVNPLSVYKTKERRNGVRDINGNLLRDTYSLAWGYDTNARGVFSSAGGRSSSVSVNSDSGISIGDRNLVVNSGAVSIGGTFGISAGQFGAVYGGSNNTVIADRGGIIGGSNNIVGGQIFEFSFPFTNVVDPSCVFIADSCETVSGDSSGSILGKNTITILGNRVTLFEIGSTVRLFDLTIKHEQETALRYFNTNGDIYDKQDVQVTSVEYINPQTNPNNINSGYTIITLSNDVIGGGIITGGKVAPLITSNGLNRYGYNSVALNNNNIAIGEDQTVVGHNNYISINARFIVGTGTGNSRGNGVTVFDNALYLQATPKRSGIEFGLSGFSGLEILNNQIRMQTLDNSTFTMGLNNVFFGYTSNDLLDNIHGLFLYKNNNTKSIDIIGSNSPINILSDINTPINLVNDRQDINLVANNYISITGNDVVTIRSINDTFNLRSGNDLIISWDSALSFSGNTFGALPVNDRQFAHKITLDNLNEYIYQDSGNILGLYKTGSYHFSDTIFTPSGSDTIDRLYNITSTEISPGNIKGYSFAVDTFPDTIDNRIIFRNFSIDNGTYSSAPNQILAWKSDVDTLGVWIDGASIISSEEFGIRAIAIFGPNGNPIRVFKADDNRSEISQIVRNLRFTYINNTIIINLRVSFDSLLSLYSLYNGQPFIIELDPSIFTKSFRGDGVTLGAWDISSNMDDRVIRARTSSGKLIRIDPIKLTNINNEATFTLIDEVI